MVEQRTQSWVRRALQGVHAMVHQNAIFTNKCSAVGNGSDSDQRQGIQQKIAQPGRQLVRLAQHLRCGPRQLPGDANAREALVGIRAARLVGIAHRGALRQLWLGQMVVGDDDVAAGFGFNAFRPAAVGDPAIDGDHQLRVVLLHGVQAGFGQAIAVDATMRNPGRGPVRTSVNKQRQQRGRG